MVREKIKKPKIFLHNRKQRKFNLRTYEVQSFKGLNTSIKGI